MREREEEEGQKSAIAPWRDRSSRPARRPCRAAIPATGCWRRERRGGR